MQPITYSVAKGLRAGEVGGFIGSIAAIRRFVLTTTKKAVWVGVLGGIAIWIVVYVPVTGILLPADLTDATFAVGTLVLHVLYAVVTAIVALSLLRRTVKTKITV